MIVDVLLNDVDPERDALRLGGFSAPESIGEVTETIGPSGLPALRFAPTEGFEGTAVFTYRPVDVLEAVGDDVEVYTDEARSGLRTTFPMLRQQREKQRAGGYLSLADFVAPRDSDAADALGAFVVTAGPGVAEAAARFRELDSLAALPALLAELG